MPSAFLGILHDLIIVALERRCLVAESQLQTCFVSRRVVEACLSLNLYLSQSTSNVDKHFKLQTYYTLTN